MITKINKMFAAGMVCFALCAISTSCTQNKDLGGALQEAVLVDEIETNVDNLLTLAPGMTHQVTAVIKTEDVTYPELVWKSVDESIATVTNNGLVTAQAVGQTSINVTQRPNVNVLKNFTVVVKPVATAISLQATSLYQRTSKQLVVDVIPADGFNLFEWSCSDESIATVDANGVITASAEKYGNVTVTAKSKDGSNLTTSAVIEVKETVPVTGIQLTSPGYDLNIGDEGTIATQLIPADATADLLEWTSSDETIVTVTNTGVVKGVNYGTATITAKAESGVTQTIDITVGEGVFNNTFTESLGSWTLEQSGSSYSLGDGCLVINMQGGGSSKWRGDFGPSTSNGRPNVTLNVGVYRYFAIKMTRPGKYLLRNNGQGTIVLDTAKGRYKQNEGNGNNVYDIVGYTPDEYANVPMDQPVVIYFDLQSQFSSSSPYWFSTTATETINLFKILVADIPTTMAGTFNIYWAHTFKTLEEMQAFAEKN